MNRRSFPVLLAGAVVAIALVLGNIAVFLVDVRLLHSDAYWVSHTDQVIAGLEKLYSRMLVAESSQRGYLLTGEPGFLADYNDNVPAIAQDLDALRKLTSDNLEQQARFPSLAQLIDARLATMAETLAVRNGPTLNNAREYVLINDGKRQMDTLRSALKEMTETELGLLSKRSQASDHTYRMALLTGCLSGLLSIAAVVAFLLLLKRYLANLVRSSDQIAEQAERLRTTLASIGDAVIATDREGRITSMNAVAEALTGWDNEDAIGETLDSVFVIVNETTRLPVVNPALRALHEGVIVGLANHTILISRNGMEWHIDDSAAPIRCRQGEIVGCVLVFRDIGERRQNELALESSARQLRAVMDTIPQMVFTATADGSVNYFNPNWLAFTGLSFGQLMDWGWDKAVHPDDLAENIRAWQFAIDTGTPFVFEHRLLRADGEYRWHLSRAAALKDDAGKILMWAGSNTDIHEQRQTADELRSSAAQLSEADRQKNNFLAMLAHELRNPLAPISNAARIVQLSVGNPDVIRAASGMMERQIRQMVRLVDDLLDLSRISLGKIEIRKEDVELARIIELATETSRGAIEAAGHELIVDLPNVPLLLHADPTRLAQAIGNLLNNAAKYSDHGGRIWLTASRAGNEIVISVKDLGFGIAAAMLPRIFEMFAQVDQSLERSKGGLGVGLTLVQRLVELHGGSITATSEGLGHGSEFIARLPVVIEAAANEMPPLSISAGGPLARRILVVDDNEDSAASLSTLLELKGHQTLIARDGLQALQQAADFLPDIVLLDIGLPRLNGYEVARKLREQTRGKSMFLIAMTGWGQDKDRQQSAQAGFDAHLVKPVDYAALTTLLADEARKNTGAG